MSIVNVEIADFYTGVNQYKTIKVSLDSFNGYLAPYCIYLGNDTFRFNSPDLLRFIGGVLNALETSYRDS